MTGFKNLDAMSDEIMGEMLRLMDERDELWEFKELYQKVRENLGLEYEEDWEKPAQVFKSKLKNMGALETFGKFPHFKVDRGPRFYHHVLRLGKYSERLIASRLKDYGLIRVRNHPDLPDQSGKALMNVAFRYPDQFTVLILPGQVTALAYKTKSGQAWKGKLPAEVSQELDL